MMTCDYHTHFHFGIASFSGNLTRTRRKWLLKYTHNDASASLALEINKVIVFFSLHCFVASIISIL